MTSGICNEKKNGLLFVLLAATHGYDVRNDVKYHANALEEVSRDRLSAPERGYEESGKERP